MNKQTIYTPSTAEVSITFRWTSSHCPTSRSWY